MLHFMSTNIHQSDKLEVLEKLEAMPEVLECHCLTGV